MSIAPYKKRQLQHMDFDSQHLISTKCKLQKQNAISILPLKLCTVQRFNKEGSLKMTFNLIHLFKYITLAHMLLSLLLPRLRKHTDMTLLRQRKHQTNSVKVAELLLAGQ